MAAVGCPAGPRLVGSWSRGPLAWSIRWQARRDLPIQAVDRSCLSNLWVHARCTVSATRPAGPSMAIQSAFVFGTCAVLH